MVVEAKTLPIQQEIDWAYIKENFKEHLPSNVCLTYVDYRDNLDGNMDEIAEAIEKNDLLDLENTVLDDWYYDQRCYYENEYWEDFEKAVIEELDDLYNDLDEPYGEVGDNIARIKDYLDNGDCIDWFRDYLAENDDSGDILKDLVHNSDEPGMFYDLNKWYGETWCWSDAEYGDAMKEICEQLSLDFHSKPVRDTLCELLANASGGGNLRIYFNADLFDMISGDSGGCKYGRREEDKTDFKSIKFNGEYYLAVYNSYEGSGHWVSIKLDCQLQFNRDNLRVSKLEHYCLEKCFGTYSNYGCDYPDFSFDEPKTKVEVNESLSQEAAQQVEYNKTFKAGGCTCGDTDFKRHRNVEYKNIPPYAGWYCPHCGMYWAD